MAEKWEYIYNTPNKERKREIVTVTKARLPPAALTYLIPPQIIINHKILLDLIIERYLPTDLSVAMQCDENSTVTTGRPSPLGKI